MVLIFPNRRSFRLATYYKFGVGKFHSSTSGSVKCRRMGPLALRQGGGLKGKRMHRRGRTMPELRTKDTSDTQYRALKEALGFLERKGITVILDNGRVRVQHYSQVSLNDLWDNKQLLTSFFTVRSVHQQTLKAFLRKRGEEPFYIDLKSMKREQDTPTQNAQGKRGKKRRRPRKKQERSRRF